MPNLVSDQLTQALVDVGVLPDHTICYDICMGTDQTMPHKIVATISVDPEKWEVALIKAGIQTLENKEAK